MPTYVFRCPRCETVREVFSKISEKEANTPDCCSEKMATVPQPVHGHVQMECRYRCPVTREGVTSWKQRREIFARKNLMDVSDVNFEKGIEKEKKKWEGFKKLANEMPRPPNFSLG